MPYTENLAGFGIRENRMLIELLQARDKQGLPDGFSDENVRPAFNTESGYVFLVNEDFQVAMMNGDLDSGGKLEIWHTCARCGNEGFDGDEYRFKDGDDGCSECRDMDDDEEEDEIDSEPEDNT